MGTVAGVAALLRFNTIFVPVIAGWRAWTLKEKSLSRKHLLLVTALPLLILMPWILRNLIVFHGEAVYSTHTGMDLVEGLLRPEGRADIAEGLAIVKETGWSMQGLEKDEPARLIYPSEPVLNQMAMRSAVRFGLKPACTGW
jgi:hypothetical protein